MTAANKAIDGLRRSLMLATGKIPGIGRHGSSVGPYVCATVELRAEDVSGVLEHVKELRRANRALRARDVEREMLLRALRDVVDCLECESPMAARALLVGRAALGRDARGDKR